MGVEGDEDLTGWLALGGHEKEGILKKRLCSLDEGLLSVDKSVFWDEL